MVARGRFRVGLVRPTDRRAERGRGPALGGFSLRRSVDFPKARLRSRLDAANVGPVHAHQRGSNRGARARGTRHFRASEAAARPRALARAPRHPPPRRSNRHRPSRGAGRRTPPPLPQQPPPLPPSPPLPPPPPRSRVRCVALPLCWHCWRPRVAAWQEPGDATRRHQYERNEPPADPL